MRVDWLKRMPSTTRPPVGTAMLLLGMKPAPQHEHQVPNSGTISVAAPTNVLLLLAGIGARRAVRAPTNLHVPHTAAVTRQLSAHRRATRHCQRGSRATRHCQRRGKGAHRDETKQTLTNCLSGASHPTHFTQPGWYLPLSILVYVPAQHSPSGKAVRRS